MKYQTLDRSCSYAALAMLLQDFSINTEDYKIITAANIPYIFRYNSMIKCYFAGPNIQGNKWFDYFLKSYGLRFKEIILKKDDFINYLESHTSKFMIGLKNGDSRHAFIYEGKKKNKYKFINIKKKHSRESDYFLFTGKELINSLDDKITIGWIEKGVSYSVINIDKELEITLQTIEKYRIDVQQFCNKKQEYSTLVKARRDLFDTFFLDVHSMMELINNRELALEIDKLRSDYMYALKFRRNIKLSDYLSLDQLDMVIIKYKDVVYKYRKNIAISARK